MTVQHQTFVKGASINIPPLFTGENYAFQKVRKQIFMKSIDSEIWKTVTNGPLVPTVLINNSQESKPREQWNIDDIRRSQQDVRARNIISYALTVDEFYRISTCKTAQEMWKMLRVTREGTDDVRRAKRV
ncbi:hypothetical protein VIGAN_07100100 [Vigna angularis var. angularis]|uniref:Uncharacterized protein n=1 Tax=Vigna angularis var. angularis TaxID=157739 RepID=A0A0S3SHJ1_PHAAN|nr:hypothetical protein VIGAN_07100100 [Vigna angularis var. angularis]